MSTQQNTQWQPAETAPKDGSHFIAYDPGAGPLFTMHWNGNEFMPEYERWTGEFTHWMPIPDAPPEEAIEQVREDRRFRQTVETLKQHAAPGVTVRIANHFIFLAPNHPVAGFYEDKGDVLAVRCLQEAGFTRREDGSWAA